MRRFAEDPTLTISIEKLVSAEVMDLRVQNGGSPNKSQWNRRDIGEHKPVEILKKEVYQELQDSEEIRRLLILEIKMRLENTDKSSINYNPLNVLRKKIQQREYCTDFSEYA